MTEIKGDMGPATLSIHAGGQPDAATGAVSPPIYQSSTFVFDNTAQGAALFKGEKPGYVYTRMGNPTVSRLEEAVAALEKGAGAITVSSGMAALNTILFAVCQSGDHIVGTNAVYGPSRIVIERDWARFGIVSTFVDTSDLAAVRSAMTKKTKIVMIETPTNPTMLISDIAAISKIAKEHGALLIVDNTFASPLLQTPITHGADIVFHSMTKFLNGHSDVVAGVIITSTKELLSKLLPAHKYLGACMDPHQSWLVLRGLRTLSLRVKAAQDNAIIVARYLAAHPKVATVYYPGMPGHPQRDLINRQMKGPGSLISFELKGGHEAGCRLLDNVKLMSLAVSLGGVETLIQHPASMTHAAMSPKDRLAAGISDGLVRLSVGCEDCEDIIADFDQAMSKV